MSLQNSDTLNLYYMRIGFNDKNTSTRDIPFIGDSFIYFSAFCVPILPR